MKNCHVCNLACEDDVEVCPICGAYLLGNEPKEEEENKTDEKIEPVLLTTFEDLVSAEIFKDILTDNKIPYSDSEEGVMKVVFGGGFASEQIFVDKTDYDKARELLEEFMSSEAEFQDEFFADEEQDGVF